MGRYLLVENKMDTVLVFPHGSNRELREVSLMPVGHAGCAETLLKSDWENSPNLDKLKMRGDIDVSESDQPAQQPFEPDLSGLKPFQIQTARQIVYSANDEMVKDLIGLDPKIGTINDPGETDRNFLRTEHLRTLKVAQEWLEGLPRTSKRTSRLKAIKSRISYITKEM